MPTQRRPLNAPDVARVSASYAQAMETTGATRWLHVSGQIPVAEDRAVPEGFEAQARLTLDNIDRQLRHAGMTRDHLVKLTVFLGARDHRAAFRDIRAEWLDGREVALTVIVCDIFDAAWLLEIEAVAAD
ncbi:MAG: RidA family protein [Pseudomonadota bacterium]